jgi:hypothetical protein
MAPPLSVSVKENESVATHRPFAFLADLPKHRAPFRTRYRPWLRACGGDRRAGRVPEKHQTLTRGEWFGQCIVQEKMNNESGVGGVLDTGLEVIGSVPPQGGDPPCLGRDRRLGGPTIPPHDGLNVASLCERRCL